MHGQEEMEWLSAEKESKNTHTQKHKLKKDANVGREGAEKGGGGRIKEEREGKNTRIELKHSTKRKDRRKEEKTSRRREQREPVNLGATEKHIHQHISA